MFEFTIYQRKNNRKITEKLKTEKLNNRFQNNFLKHAINISESCSNAKLGWGDQVWSEMKGNERKGKENELNRN